MIRHTVSRPRLATVVSIVLGLPATACCPDLDDSKLRRDHDGVVDADRLVEIREENPTDEERCEAACIDIVERADGMFQDVVSCKAFVDVGGPPWEAVHTSVNIACTVEFQGGGFCTGRRPQGHREHVAPVTDLGAWFAVHAHLERASVAAFAELAAWLQDRGAPAELVVRCRDAATDESVHADMMGALARQAGAAVPPCEAESAPDDLLAVAIHNAVEGCVHESFAAIVAAHQARHAEARLGRDAFGQIAGDELRHGELAWDLHAWLMGQLDADGRAVVERAQANALSRLPERVAANARATPVGLGWPAPELAAQMARRFADLMAA